MVISSRYCPAGSATWPKNRPSHLSPAASGTGFKSTAAGSDIANQLDPEALVEGLAMTRKLAQAPDLAGADPDHVVLPGSIRHDHEVRLLLAVPHAGARIGKRGDDRRVGLDFADRVEVVEPAFQADFATAVVLLPAGEELFPAGER